MSTSTLSAFRIQNSAFPPAGGLTLILGHPGIGNSLLSLDLAAHLSRGHVHPALPHLSPPASPFPQDPGLKTQVSPASSLLASLDDSAETNLSRLHAAGADLSRIHLLPRSLELNLLPSRPTFLHPHPQPSLIAALLNILPTLDNPRLLILDPIPAFLGTTDCSNPSTVRRTLRPLLQLAHQQNLTILGIAHLPKPRAPHQPPRILGSQAFMSLASHIFHLTHPHSSFAHSDLIRHSSFDLRHSRLLIPLKSPTPIPHAFPFTITNLPINMCQSVQSPEHSASSQFPIPISQFPHPDHWPPTAAHLTWHSPLPLPPESRPPDPAIPDSQLDRAVDFLQEILAQGPIPSATLRDAARARGLSKRTLLRAHAALAIESFRDGQSCCWFCALPSALLHNP